MTSNKRRTTSKSGRSAKSKTRATSSRNLNSSPTAPASFEQIFGAPESDELQNLKASLARYQGMAAEMRNQGEPKLALYRTRHRARLARIQRFIRELQEAITSLTADKGNN